MSRPSHSDGSVYIKGRSVTSVEPPLSVGAGVVLVEGVSGDAMNPYSMIALDQQTMQKKWEAPLIGSTASGWFEAPSIAHDFAIACIGVIRVWNRRYRRQRLAECRQPDLQVTTHRSGRTLHLHPRKLRGRCKPRAIKLCKARQGEHHVAGPGCSPISKTAMGQIDLTRPVVREYPSPK